MAFYREINDKYANLTDEDLMTALQQGDRDAHSVLYVRHSERLRTWARRKGVPHCDVEEPVQETFLRVLKERARFNPSRRFSPWVSQMFYHCLIDYFRRSRRLTDNAGHLIEEFHHNPTQSVLDGIYLNGCADKIGEEDWELYIEWKAEGRTLRDLSEFTSIPVSTLHRRLQDTEQTLKECLESKGGTSRASLL